MPTTIYGIGSGNFDDNNGYKSGTPISSVRNATAYTALSDLPPAPVVHGKLAFGTLYVFRMLIAFDLSGESGTVTSADLKLTSARDITGFGTYLTYGSTHICKINPSGATWGGGDMDSLDGWVSSGTYSGNVTEYATAFTNVEQTTHTVALNSDAITDINSAVGSGNFNICLVNSADFTYDTSTGGLGSPAGSGFFNGAGARFKVSEDSTAGNRPQIELTYGTVTVTHNANFFGSNF